jgi:hypothetical protein
MLGNASDHVAHACPDEGGVFRGEAFLGFALGFVVPFNLKKHGSETAESQAYCVGTTPAP